MRAGWSRRICTRQALSTSHEIQPRVEPEPPRSGYGAMSDGGDGTAPPPRGVNSARVWPGRTKEKTAKHAPKPACHGVPQDSGAPVGPNSRPRKQAVSASLRKQVVSTSLKKPQALGSGDKLRSPSQASRSMARESTNLLDTGLLSSANHWTFLIPSLCTPQFPQNVQFTDRKTPWQM